VLHLLAPQTDTAITSAGLTAGDWLAAGAIFVVGIILGRAVQAVLVRVVHRGDAEHGAALALGRFVGFVLAAAGLVYGLADLGVRLGPLVGALGIGGLAVAFAAQTILANFLASIILQLRRPFHRGDQVSTNGCEGTVEDVNFRTVVVRTFAGERIMVPCSQVLDNPITNHTALGRRRTTLSVSVSYDADVRMVRDVLLDALHGTNGVLERPAPEVWVKELGESGVDLAVRFWHAPDVATLWRVRNEVALVVKEALDRAGVDIPYPQRVLRFVGEREGVGRESAPAD
jgi:small conductance mechanosensitive channel